MRSRIGLACRAWKNPVRRDSWLNWRRIPLSRRDLRSGMLLRNPGYRSGCARRSWNPLSCASKRSPWACATSRSRGSSTSAVGVESGGVGRRRAGNLGKTSRKRCPLAVISPPSRRLRGMFSRWRASLVAWRAVFLAWSCCWKSTGCRKCGVATTVWMPSSTACLARARVSSRDCAPSSMAGRRWQWRSIIGGLGGGVGWWWW